MAFIHDFWRYCSCYEVTRNNAIWSAFGALGAAVNRKVYTHIGEIRINSNIYILLVGPPGSGKSTGRDFAWEIFQEACPHIKTAASKQSHGDIIKQMASGDCTIHYQDQHGREEEAAVFGLFIDEFKNFIAYDVIGMVSFLTGIHGAKDKFDASTLSRGAEVIIKPSLNMLACENPDTLIKYIKMDAISSGFGRRVNIIYDCSAPESKPQIIVPEEISKLKSLHMVEELKRISTVVGEYTHTPESQKFYNDWYHDNRKRLREITDPVFAGYVHTKHIQLLKLAMLMDVSSNTKPSFKFSPELFQICLAFFDIVEKNMPKLFAAGGRNELAAPQQRLVDVIQAAGGALPRREVERITGRDLSPIEQHTSISYLIRTQQLFAGHEDMGKFKREMLYTPEGYHEATKAGKVIKL